MVRFDTPDYYNPNKHFVDIKAIFDKEGSIRPISVYLDEQEFSVGRIIDIRPAASLKSGGAGIRYTCYVDGKRTYLFLEDNKWFFELCQ